MTKRSSPTGLDPEGVGAKELMEDEAGSSTAGARVGRSDRGELEAHEEGR